mgnify:FL=1
MEVAIYRQDRPPDEIVPVSGPKLQEIQSEMRINVDIAKSARKAGFERQAGKYRHQATLAERRLSPAPQFPEITRDEFMIWIQFLPVTHWESTFADYEGVVPDEVIGVVAKCNERKTFDGMEIRTDTDYNSQHHALFGSTTDICTKRYLVARWCEGKLISFKEICGILSAREVNAARLKRRSSWISLALFVVSISALALTGIKGSNIWMVLAGISTIIFLISSVYNKSSSLNAAKEAKRLEAYAATL